MRRQVFLWAIAAAALAVLLFACDLSSGGGGTAEGAGTIEVAASGALRAADPANPPDHIGCTLMKDGEVVSTWTVAAGEYTTTAASFDFTRADLPIGTYTLKAELFWVDDDPQKAEWAGTSGSFYVTPEWTTRVPVELTPDFHAIIEANNDWMPSNVTTYTTPTEAGYYRPQWFRLGPFPAGTQLKINVANNQGLNDLHVYKPGTAEEWSVLNMSLEDLKHYTVAIADAEGTYWACIVGHGELAGLYRIKYVHP